MRYTAEAVAHGHLPALVTQALNAPRGINLMWNTSFLLPSLAMAPVTLLGGPQASLTLMLTLGYAGGRLRCTGCCAGTARASWRAASAAPSTASRPHCLTRPSVTTTSSSPCCRR